MSKLFYQIGRTFYRINGGFLIILVLTFVLGWQLGHRDYVAQWTNFKPNLKIVNEQPFDRNTNIDFKLFWETWDLVSSKYIDKKALDPQKLYYGAIQGMVAAIGDPYTVFLPPEAQKASKEQLGGSFEGVGLQLGYNKDKRLSVIAPLKGTPAEKAGVRAGDLIFKINDKDAINLSLPEAVSLIRGPKSSQVSLSLIRDNEPKPIDVQITRDTIVVKTIELQTKTTKPATPAVTPASTPTQTRQSAVETKTTKSGKSVAYIRVSQFGEKTRGEWDQAISDALAQAPQGVIVDVRNNPGGFLDAAIYLASDFLDGEIVVIQEDARGNRQVLSTVFKGRLLKLPVVILINKGSASASEILSGAIQDHKRGILVGEQTFGKGTIQTTEDLPGGTGLHITTAKWLTPSERWIHNVGLTPDIKVEVKDNDPGDPQLDKALEVLN